MTRCITCTPLRNIAGREVRHVLAGTADNHSVVVETHRSMNAGVVVHAPLKL